MSGSKQYSIAQARSSLPTIVDEAEAGVDVELTRRGKPVAAVISLEKLERLRGERPRFADAYRDFLTKYSLDEVGLDEAFVRSLREKDRGREVGF
jgi:prevent-host-death family protein